jgi:ABC-2 type transport system permease protein
MRFLIELAKRGFQLQMSYRAAMLAGLATNFFFGLLRAIVIIALYGEKTMVADISLTEAITYTALTQAVIGYLSAFNWNHVMNSIYSGDIVSDLLKPMSFYSYWLARDFGRAAAAFLTRGVTIMIAYAFIISLSFPNSFNHWRDFFIVSILAWWISFSWHFIVNLAAFWIPNAIGISRFFFMASLFFSGFLMPLRFFPEWVQKAAFITPFPYTVNAMVEVYLGLQTHQDTIILIARQLIWGVGLLLLGQIILQYGIKKLVILGG